MDVPAWCVCNFNHAAVQAGPMRPANPHPSFPKLIKFPWQKLHGLGTVVPVAAAGTIWVDRGLNWFEEKKHQETQWRENNNHIKRKVPWKPTQNVDNSAWVPSVCTSLVLRPKSCNSGAEEHDFGMGHVHRDEKYYNVVITQVAFSWFITRLTKWFVVDISNWWMFFQHTQIPGGAPLVIGDKTKSIGKLIPWRWFEMAVRKPKLWFGETSDISIWKVWKPSETPSFDDHNKKTSNGHQSFWRTGRQIRSSTSEWYPVTVLSYLKLGIRQQNMCFTTMVCQCINHHKRS